jgi:hypothetical protein
MLLQNWNRTTAAARFGAVCNTLTRGDHENVDSGSAAAPGILRYRAESNLSLPRRVKC